MMAGLLDEGTTRPRQALSQSTSTYGRLKNRGEGLKIRRVFERPKTSVFGQVVHYFGDTIDSGTCKDDSERDFGQPEICGKTGVTGRVLLS